VVKGNVKMESPIVSQLKNKRHHNDIEHEGILKERGKMNKVGKIDREELHKLQEKKQHKKTDLSSNRKKTKRMLGTAKSVSNMIYYGKLTNSSSKFPNKKTYANSSCKKLDNSKKETPKREEKLLPNHQDWQRMEKAHKKLNRVNICKLQ
jgi:hypothetical protein